MATIASRSFNGPRHHHRWTPWVLLSVPLIGIGGLVYKSINTVSKPTISVFAAVENNDLRALHAHALTGTVLNQLDKSGHSALYEAIADEHYAAAHQLLRDGANPNAGNPEQETPLMLASGQGDADLVNELLHSGAFPNYGPPSGMSALYEGVNSGNSDVVAALLAHGAEPNNALADGSTPLSVAAWQGNVRIVKLLVASGARPDAKGYLGHTPLGQAKARRHEQIVALLQDVQTKS